MFFYRSFYCIHYSRFEWKKKKSLTRSMKLFLWVFLLKERNKNLIKRKLSSSCVFSFSPSMYSSLIDWIMMLEMLTKKRNNIRKNLYARIFSSFSHRFFIFFLLFVVNENDFSFSCKISKKWLVFLSIFVNKQKMLFFFFFFSPKGAADFRCLVFLTHNKRDI